MRTVHRYLFLIVAAVVAAMAGCATTQIRSSWKDPDFAAARFAKTLVVFQSRDEGLRRILEDEMARDIPNATPAYSVLRSERPGTPQLPHWREGLRECLARLDDLGD